MHGDPHGQPIDRLRRLRKWSIVILSGFAIAIFPWTLYLTYTLPSRHLTPHWDIAWAGFDGFEAVAAIATVVALLRSSPGLPIIAATTGTFLVCDAWFDCVTSRPGRELASALISAIVAELPLAALCFWLAHDAERAFAAAAAVAGLRPKELRDRRAAGRARART